SYVLRTDGGGRARVEFVGVSAAGATSIVYKDGYPTIPEEPADGETPAIPAKSTVPEPIKVAILLLVGHWYQNREAATAKSISELPYAVSALIAPYRRIEIG